MPRSFSSCAATPARDYGLPGRQAFHVSEGASALAVVHVDRAASFVAADATKLVAAFAAVRAALKRPVQPVLLLAKGQKICSRTDTPARARLQLAAAGVAVYRLTK